MSLNQRECIYITANGSVGAGVAIQQTAGGALATTTCAIARTGAGVYTLTFSRAIKLAEFMVLFGCTSAAASGNCNASVNGAGTVWTISTSLAAVATDEDFYFYAEPLAL